MADDLLYHFSDKDDDDDAVLDRAFDRWEKLGGGSARGTLFQFTMQPLNRSQQLPAPYKRLIDEIKRN